MKDIDKLKTLLTKFGVLWREENRSGIMLHIEQPQEKVGGYNGFATYFHFDKEGKFKEMGAWE